ncbi:MAG: GNAT family N-acetyltransferase [Caldilineaceae bacterium]
MQAASIHFQTDRLTASAFTFQDLDELRHLHQDEQVMRTLGGIRSAEQTEHFLAEKIKHWQTHGFGYWIFRHQATADFVGRAGLQHIHIGGRDEVEVGYTVARRHWGQGYATEMAQAMIDIAFQQLALPTLVCFTLTTNLPSQRVMRKVGFTFERKITHANQPHVLYRLNRESVIGD